MSNEQVSEFPALRIRCKLEYFDKKQPNKSHDTVRLNELM